MKVKELVEYLNTLDGDMEVITENEYDGDDYYIVDENDFEIEKHVFNGAKYVYWWKMDESPDYEIKDCLRIF